MDIKKKAFKGIYWNSIDTITNYGFQFVLHIVLARLLLPSEYGLIGMVGIFIAIASAFVDGGFGQAIIHKRNATDLDYSTVLYFSLSVSICFYLILFFSADLIAVFFSEPMLAALLRVIALQLIISPFVEIQRIRLICRIDFKTQALVAFLSNIIAGSIGLLLAYNGYGVWSLVIWKLAEQVTFAVTIWMYSRWLPFYGFSYQSFKELFRFGSKLFLGSLVETIYREINKFVIAKFYSPTQLGYFTRAEQFGNLPATILTGIISKVSFPTFVGLRDDSVGLKKAFSRIIRSTMFISFLGMFTVIAVANPLVNTLIGSNWSQSVLYLQIVCLYGALYPLHSINLNILKVFGRSDLVLKLELIKRMAAIPIVFVGIYCGIIWLLIGTVVHSVTCYFINSYWSRKLIDYTIRQQLLDLLPSFILATIVSLCTYIVGVLFVSLQPFWILLIQLSSTFLFVVILSEVFKLQDYAFIKNLVLRKSK